MRDQMKTKRARRAEAGEEEEEEEEGGEGERDREGNGEPAAPADSSALALVRSWVFYFATVVFVDACLAQLQDAGDAPVKLVFHRPCFGVLVVCF